MSRKRIRCAIYTRKSSDEGLDQSFNSLDAQRDAAEAYVKSQTHEGWTVLPALYDDGGYSGGSMERPGLQCLLGDVDAGLIDVVVVYKIDRLTRSLPDFARIVERFDAREVSFVSVTQSFNTTSSMGRLTLNVLLSFAQFEREVAGERIRDKIAASKAKGMWMGGNLPLGYDLPAPGTRTLQVNEVEAETIRHFFTRYLELKSVHKLQRDLADRGIVSKQRITRRGRTSGGCPFNRGALFHLLANPIYIGRIRHKGVIHEGAHQGIVDEDLFGRVQQQLASHAPRRRAEREQRFERSPLAGKLFDAMGEVMTPTYARGSKGKHYRYYVSASLQQGGKPKEDGTIRRIGGPDLEHTITELITRGLPPCKSPLDLLLAIHLRNDGMIVDLPATFEKVLLPSLKPDETVIHSGTEAIRVLVPITVPLRGGKRMIIAGSQRQARPDPVLIAALRQAHSMVPHKRGLPFVEASPGSPHIRRIQRLAFLAPDIQRDILTGHQPPSLNLERLKQIDIPLDWNEQREALGWPAIR